MTWTLSAFTDEAGAEIDQQITACQRGGLTHLDLRNIGKTSIIDLPVDQAKQICQKLDSANIKVHMFGSPIGKIDIADDFNIDLKRLNHLGELAKVFDCNKVRMFSYYNKNNIAKDQWQTQSLERLKQLRDQAGKLNLALYHENESDIFGDLPEDVAQIAELRDENTFKLIYDFANYVTAGVDNWQAWQIFKDKTDCFHLKDKKTTGEHMPMGQGDGQADKILADAAANNWQGVCVLEPHLSHSEAVLSTGPSGTGNQQLAKMPLSESFQIAVEAAQKLLKNAQSI